MSVLQKWIYLLALIGLAACRASFAAAWKWTWPGRRESSPPLLSVLSRGSVACSVTAPRRAKLSWRAAELSNGTGVKNPAFRP